MEDTVHKFESQYTVSEKYEYSGTNVPIVIGTFHPW